MRSPAVLTTLLLLSCVPPAPPPPATFSVARGFIRDPQGRAVILRGANVSGRHKEPPYFDFHGADDFARMRRDWGMNSVRFLVSWAALEPVRDAYDDAYLDEVARRVKLATDAGLLVFADLHQDLYGVGFLGRQRHAALDLRRGELRRVHAHAAVVPQLHERAR